MPRTHLGRTSVSASGEVCLPWPALGPDWAHLGLPRAHYRDTHGAVTDAQGLPRARLHGHAGLAPTRPSRQALRVLLGAQG